MKFKVYPWTTIWHDGDKRCWSWIIEFIPSIGFHRSHYDFDPDESFPESRVSDYFHLIFSWLIFGLTFDLRLGDDEEE